MENENGITQNEQHPSITQNEQKIDQQPVQPEGSQSNNKGSKINLKIAVLGVVIAIVLLVVGLFSFYSQKKEVVGKKLPPPEPENVLLATVGDKQIYRTDVKKLALTQYLQSAIDSKVMRLFLDIAVERVILDQEAVRLGLATVPEALRNNAYYDTLKEEVSKGNISKMNATQIGWWIPPPGSYPQVPLYETQRTEGANAVVDITAQFNRNVPVIEILKNTYDKYPSLQSILSINGTRYTGETNPADLPINRDFDYDKAVAYFPKNKIMIGMKEGQVKSSIFEDKSGAVVVKVNSITEGEKISYNDWLQEKIKSSVTFNQGAVDSL